MEPSTPPRSSRGRDFPATPATPRYGSFGDLPDQPRKPHSVYNSTPDQNATANTRTPQHRCKRPLNALATPRQTPHKRRDVMGNHEHHHIREPKCDDLFHKLTEPEPVPLAQQKAVQPHPHQDAPPPNVPGMWYVFRGKKVFRPLAKDEEPVEPVTLFKDIIDERKQRKPGRPSISRDLFKTSEYDSGSEADTDVEWDSV